MSKKTAFLTTIFPLEKKYLQQFFSSLQQQSYSNFDVIIINDGYEDFSVLQDEFFDLNIVELVYSGTPSQNRQYGINYVKQQKYEFLIFGDSDDFFDPKRVEVSLEYLQEFDIVINDIALFKNSEVYENKYISNRLEDGDEISLDFILDKNIFGLSNTALKVSILDLDSTTFDSGLVAVDWFLYTKLLLKKYRAVFTNQVQTYYRQYDSNTVGLGIRTSDTILKNRLIKSKHYELLSGEHSAFEILNAKEIELQLKSDFFELLQRKIEFPLWWED